MDQQPITADMKVWQVYQRYPQTMDVFLKYGCPDMRRGIFPVMARIMRIKRDARVHKIPLDPLMQDLNKVAGSS